MPQGKDAQKFETSSPSPMAIEDRVSGYSSMEISKKEVTFSADQPSA